MSVKKYVKRLNLENISVLLEHIIDLLSVEIPEPIEGNV